MLPTNKKFQTRHFNRVSLRFLVNKSLEVRESETQGITGHIFDMNTNAFMMTSKMEIVDNKEHNFELTLSKSISYNIEANLIFFRLNVGGVRYLKNRFIWICF